MQDNTSSKADVPSVLQPNQVQVLEGETQAELSASDSVPRDVENLQLNTDKNLDEVVTAFAASLASPSSPRPHDPKVTEEAREDSEERSSLNNFSRSMYCTLNEELQAKDGVIGQLETMLRKAEKEIQLMKVEQHKNTAGASMERDALQVCNRVLMQESQNVVVTSY
jgi:ribosomal protein L12E/L44/L45/RPP1/RPP2